MKLGILASASLAVLLSSCLSGLEGGDPRVQLRNTWSDTVRAITVGTWERSFQPSVAPGGMSEMVELPVAGRLTVGIRGVHEGRDTLLGTREIEIGYGESIRLE
jgi:hypothetical protein